MDPARTIVVTGCSTGIGRHCALALKERGWRVIATARSDEAIADLKAQGLEAIYLDYAEEASVAVAADNIAEMTGGELYALFNNGGYGQPGALEDLPREALRLQFESNVFGWHELTQRLLPLMRAHGSGRIVQNSSVVGFVALKGRGAYVASKYATEGLSDTLRLELDGSGIHVCSIAPGPVRSEFRINALKHFKRHLSRDTATDPAFYDAQLKRLENPGESGFTLGPEAVMDKLMHALTSARPKPNYYVTVPTHGLVFLRRILPRRWLHNMVVRIGG